MRKALGLIEVYGLVAAVTVADDMVKCANVELLGYELAKGSGMATVKIEGDVGAVQAAISCGETTARSMNMFVSKKVIARPAEGLEVMINNSLTVGYAAFEEKPSEIVEKQPEAKSKPQKETSFISKPQTLAEKTPAAKTPKPVPKPAPKPASKPAPKPAPKPSPKTASKPATKTAPAASQKTEAEPENIPEAAPEIK